ncbi:MAG TPA: sodium:proton antiporter, partial [Cyanobacteria bacterium UBA11372]|nr:sodium:proton antiporter [Cyanobacteria bacterium UBA11372]
SLIVMGWGQITGFRARFFGNVIDNVLWTSHCPVALVRLLLSPTEIQRILVPIENLTAEAVRPVRFAQILAQGNQGQVTLLHVCDRNTTTSKRAWTQSQLALLASKWAPQSNFDIQIVPHEDIVRAILNASQSTDLVILRSKRRRTAGGLAISDLTTQLVQQLNCSLVMLGEPQRALTGVPTQRLPNKVVPTIG